mmetsp:Transcript_16789/g.35319  ORF Transcript_16789/g.35319 Transcript_16789/m.35319 type:complete len:465 (+) Transcript_16789:138-1532(+)
MLIRGSNRSNRPKELGDALRIESKVEVRYGKSRRPTGIISKINNDKTCMVDFGGEERTKDVSRHLIYQLRDETKAINQLEKGHRLPSEQKKLEVSTAICIGDATDEDASNEVGDPPEMRISNSSSDSDEIPYQIGDRVEAKYRGKGRRYYKGTIVGVQSEGLYNIKYDDGDKDCDLSDEFIRLLEVPAIKAKKRQTGDRAGPSNNDVDNWSVFEVGQKVEAKYRNRGHMWYKCTIVSVLPNGLYNVKYNDGDRDKKLPASAIRSVIVTDLEGQKQLLRGDAKVPQVTTNGKHKGRENECGLSAKVTKSLEKNRENNTRGGKFVRRSGGIQTFHAVESKRKGRGVKYYKRTVAECLANGTYNIQSVDGDNDFELGANFVDAIESPPNEEVAPSSGVVEGLVAMKVPTSQKARDDSNERSVGSRQKESINAKFIHGIDPPPNCDVVPSSLAVKGTTTPETRTSQKN